MPIILTHQPRAGDLFVGLAAPVKPAPVTRSRAKPKPTIGWEITNHVCLGCMGRILKSVAPSGVVTVRCADCGATAEGHPSAICWCGHKQRSTKAAQRFKCRINANPTPEFSSEIEVVELR